MGSPFEIDISMTSATVDGLKNSGFALYAFKAVKSTVSGGAPLVWFRTTQLLTSVSVTWQEQYQAYISADEIIANGKIRASTACDIDLGQTAKVSANGNMIPDPNGTAGAVSIYNEGTTQWTTGISQFSNGQPSPLCAIPLYGQNLDVVVPISKVLLMFASNTVNTGTVLYKAYSPGLMVDLTAAPTRAVSYDLNGGWDWTGGTWATRVKANDNLVPLLITT
ncbi:MAG: hypothetical protein ABW360_16305 [Phenylobacterium sp.]